MRGSRDDERDERDEEPRERRGNKGLVLLAAVIGVLLLAGAVAYFLIYGGETNAEVIAKQRSKFADMRGKLKRIAEKLPPAGSVGADNLPANLNPKPVFDVPNKTFNTVFLPVEQCIDPDRELRSPAEFNLGFHEDDFHTHLLWTGDKSPLAESARKQPAKDLAKRMEQTLGFAYLVVSRPASYTPPWAVNDKTFAGGDLDLEVLLIDLPGEKVLGGFRRALRPDPNVMVTFRKGESEAQSAEGWVYSNLWLKARSEVTATLARGTGGTFNTEPARK